MGGRARPEHGREALVEGKLQDRPRRECGAAWCDLLSIGIVRRAV